MCIHMLKAMYRLEVPSVVAFYITVNRELTCHWALRNPCMYATTQCLGCRYKSVSSLVMWVLGFWTKVLELAPPKKIASYARAQLILCKAVQEGWLQHCLEELLACGWISVEPWTWRSVLSDSKWNLNDEKVTLITVPEAPRYWRWLLEATEV